MFLMGSNQSDQIIRCCLNEKTSNILDLLIPRLHQAKSRHQLQLGRHRFQFYDKCKQVQVDLGRIKKVELFEKSKLLFSNLFLKISQIIVIDLHFFCSVNRSRNRIHVDQAWHVIFYCIDPGYW